MKTELRAKEFGEFSITLYGKWALPTNTAAIWMHLEYNIIFSPMKDSKKHDFDNVTYDWSCNINAL